MRRRSFIRALGGAATWPLAVRAQQSERVRRIGVLMHSAADEPESQARLAAFMQGLQELGWAVDAICGSIIAGARNSVQRARPCPDATQHGIEIFCINDGERTNVDWGRCRFRWRSDWRRHRSRNVATGPEVLERRHTIWWSTADRRELARALPDGRQAI